MDEKLTTVHFPYDLSKVDLAESIIDDLERFTGVLPALNPTGAAARVPFTVARACAAPFRNREDLLRRIQSLEDQPHWGRAGAVANTATGLAHFIEASAVAVKAIRAKFRQADLDARAHARRS